MAEERCKPRCPLLQATWQTPGWWILFFYFCYTRNPGTYNPWSWDIINVIWRHILKKKCKMQGKTVERMREQKLELDTWCSLNVLYQRIWNVLSKSFLKFSLDFFFYFYFGFSLVFCFVFLNGLPKEKKKKSINQLKIWLWFWPFKPPNKTKIFLYKFIYYL